MQQVTGPDEYGSMYIYLQPDRKGEIGAVAKTVTTHSDLLVDYDSDGNLYGIELLNVVSKIDKPIATKPYEEK